MLQRLYTFFHLVYREKTELTPSTARGFSERKFDFQLTTIFLNTDWRMGEQLFDFEGVAHHLTNRMVKGEEMDAVHKAKIEYGLALLLGVIIELILTVGVSAIFGTIVYTLVIIFSALALRVFTGGSHCSSYRRCLVFSMAFFTGLSLAARWIASQINVYPLIEVILIPANIGIFFQAFMQTAIGKNFVLASDKLMQKIGI
ncbi:MAG: accessory gene regulator B family protein [Dehalobacter sp.]|nr:accessory gene regulator B family protein [Dehalobacter sp.]MDJ0304530.1 accessory gene regulator B family protein [Dehalobacter sp.]